MVVSARGVVKGTATGEAMVFSKPFSFLGDVDMGTGIVIARGHEHEGKSIAGKVMIYPETKGSSGGCVVLMVLARAKLGPAAIVLSKPADTNIVEGAIITGIPLLAELPQDARNLLETGDRLTVDGSSGTIEVLPAE
jgi:predicted aconitase with swiveling domain